MVEDANIVDAKARCQETASQLVHLLLENLDLLGPFTGGTEVNYILIPLLHFNHGSIG